jgi:hypothetical protein
VLLRDASNPGRTAPTCPVLFAGSACKNEVLERQLNVVTVKEQDRIEQKDFVPARASVFDADLCRPAIAKCAGVPRVAVIPIQRCRRGHQGISLFWIPEQFFEVFGAESHERMLASLPSHPPGTD